MSALPASTVVVSLQSAITHIRTITRRATPLRSTSNGILAPDRNACVYHRFYPLFSLLCENRGYRQKKDRPTLTQNRRRKLRSLQSLRSARRTNTSASSPCGTIVVAPRQQRLRMLSPLFSSLWTASLKLISTSARLSMASCSRCHLGARRRSRRGRRKLCPASTRLRSNSSPRATFPRPVRAHPFFLYPQLKLISVGDAWWAKGWRIARNATSRRTYGSASPVVRSAVGASSMVAWVGTATRSRTLQKVSTRSVSNSGLSPPKATPVSRILHSCIQADGGGTRYILLRVQRVADRPRARPPSCQFWHQRSDAEKDGKDDDRTGTFMCLLSNNRG